jgi:cell wall-associated NlpC family hydrolase
MLMRKRFILFTFACIIANLLTSCHTSEQAVSGKSSHQPKFISNVYIEPHNRSSATADAIDHSKKPVASKNNTKTHHTKVRQTPVVKPAVAAKSPETAPLTPIITNKELPSGARKKYSEMLGVTQGEINNSALYNFIDKWLGTNYRIGGCDIQGIDCSGFAQKLYSEVYGIDLLRTARDQFSNCKRIKNASNAVEGDLVFFHIRSKHISHVGIYLTNKYFVHASTSNGVIISNLNEEYWSKYYAGCGRIPRG